MEFIYAGEPACFAAPERACASALAFSGSRLTAVDGILVEAAKRRLHCACVPAELESIASLSEGSFPDGRFLEIIIKTIGNWAGCGARVFYDFQRF